MQFSISTDTRRRQLQRQVTAGQPIRRWQGWSWCDQATEADRGTLESAIRFFAGSTFIRSSPCTLIWRRSNGQLWEGAFSWPLLQQLGTQSAWLGSRPEGWAATQLELYSEPTVPLRALRREAI